jgi:indolepyruvate decarboxylase
VLETSEGERRRGMVGYSIGDYLIRNLYGRGIKHAFGVPGDYILSFYDRLTKSNISVINMCDEQGAGFAADAYARVRGLGLVCITYGVGALKVINTTAQAYAEKSPVVVISGAPGISEQVRNPLLHHKVRDFNTQRKIFEEITVAYTILNDSKTAVNEINRVLSQALRFKRPVYIELPRDMVFASISGAGPYYDASEDLESKEQQSYDADALQEATAEAAEMINAAVKPIIIAGEEIHRFGLQDRLLAFAEKTRIPIAATILSKSVISELHPLYIGIYGGIVGQESARQNVESSDCIVILGASLSDITLGMFTAQIDEKKTIYVSAEKLSVKYHQYQNIGIIDFLDALISSKIKVNNSFNKDSASLPPQSPATPDNDTASNILNEVSNSSSNNNSENNKYVDGKHLTFPKLPGTMRTTTRTASQSNPTRGNKITVKYLFEYLNSSLTDEMIVLADVGDALFAGADLIIHGNTKFLSPAYYASLGFAVPASVGVQLASPSLRPLVLVGDGAFQMTGMELSTALRYKLNPIVIVLNNGVYLTEQLMLAGRFNELQQWNFDKVPNIIGGGHGFLVNTEEEFADAFSKALQIKDALSILDVRLDQNDKSSTLDRLTQGLAKKFQAGPQ